MTEAATSAGAKSAPGAPRKRLALPQQLEKLERMIAARVKVYELSHRKGTLNLVAAAEKQAELADIRASFRFLVANIDWIKPEAERRLARRREQQDIDEAIASDPAAAALAAALPEATPSLLRKPGRPTDEAEPLPNPDHEDAA